MNDQDEELDVEVRRSRKLTAQRGARWVATVDRLAFAFYEGAARVEWRSALSDTVVDLSARLREVFAWGAEIHAAAAASGQHAFVLDFSHYVGGSVTLNLDPSGAVELTAMFDAPESLSVGFLSRRTGELLDLHVEGQVTDLILVQRPLFTASFHVDLAGHEMEEVVAVAYE